MIHNGYIEPRNSPSYCHGSPCLLYQFIIDFIIIIVVVIITIIIIIIIINTIIIIDLLIAVDLLFAILNGWIIL